MMDLNNIDFKCINTMRGIAIDAIEKSKSGHPGLPLGAAPMAYILWHRHLRINPTNPKWLNRDRFVLSAGHGSMLLYSLLNLSGHDLPMEEIKRFRQFESKTPGHPEYGMTAGVEVSTGPLGQGAANSVGMAIAERMLAAKFNKPDYAVIDHYTYALMGDGCIMEGITSEAVSLAGHLKLGKLIWLYDANDISLDGPLSLSMTENVAGKFENSGWQVITVADGDHDLDSLDKAIAAAKAETGKPSLILVKTTIGYGSPKKQGTCGAHGAPLGTDEARATKAALGLNPEENFAVSEDVFVHFGKISCRGKHAECDWNDMMEKYTAEFGSLAMELYDYTNLELSEEWTKDAPVFKDGESVATRKSGSMALNGLAKNVGWLVGGDADLSCSTLTYMNGLGDFDGQTGEGRNIHFGVREHAMAAIANGIAFHGGLKAYVSTFFSFADYMRPSIRLAALCKIPVIFAFTHDSVAVGEDGPTHQPIEQLTSLRIIPGLITLRPGDANEALEAWKFAISYNEGPVVLVLSRQNLLTIDRTKYAAAENLSKGAYVLADHPNAQGIIIATGSEVGLALTAAEKLAAENKPVRVVSMPSQELFNRQDAAYKEAVLPARLTKRVAVEAGVSFGWQQFVGNSGRIIGIDTFGISAPGDEVLAHFGFTVENVVKVAKEIL